MDSIRALTATGSQLGVGVLLLAISLSFGVLPFALGVEPMDWRVALGMGLVGVVLSAWGARRLAATADGLSLRAQQEPEPKMSTLLYGQYLVGIGFALLVVALSTSTLLAGLAWSASRVRAPSATATSLDVGGTRNGSALAPGSLGEFSMPERFGSLFGATPIETYFVVTLFVLSTLLAMLGALFFFANALWDRLKDPEREEFDARVFWAGLWFRLGEAVLFNLVLFLLLRTYAPERYLFLPVVSLMVGMFLKSGEAMVTGIAERVFAAFKALVPTTMNAPSVQVPWDFFVTGLPEPVLERVSKLKLVVEDIESIKGVSRVESDVGRAAVSMEFDPQIASRAKIRHAVEFRGFQVVEPVAA